MMKRFQFSSRSVPFALFLLSVISFAPLVHQLGYYWDDWPSVWFLHFWGPASFHENFAIDRPLLAYIFQVTTPLLGESTLGWQLFGVLTRWLVTLAFWWVLRLIWPKHLPEVSAVAFLFAIYPGFRQQYISVTYSNAFLVYTIFLVSFGTMLMALRNPRWTWLWMLLSITCAGLTLFTVEYFFGLELLRPVVLWFHQRGSITSLRQRFKKVALQWLPYLILVLAFLVWRIFLHKSPRGEIILFDQLASQPVSAILGLLTTIAQDLLQTTALAWKPLFEVFPRTMVKHFGMGTLVAFSAVVVSAALLTILFLSRLQNNSIPEQGKSIAPAQQWGAQAMLAGAAALLVGGWPFWVTNLQIDLFFPKDRFTLPLMIGVVLFLGGIISLVARKRVYSAILVAVLVSLSAGMHYQDALRYRQEWDQLKDLFWQLSWRAPQIKPGTTLLSGDLYLEYFSDNSLTAPLNWMYAPDNTALKMPYLFLDIEARLGNSLPSLDANIPIDMPYRAASFSGNTSQAIVLFYAPPRCLKVVHPVNDLDLPFKPKYIGDAFSLSNLSLIDTSNPEAAHPPLHIFGNEPDHGWCYYFEKADLAAQTKDWAQIVAFSYKAFENQPTLTRETASELIPFIQAFAHTGEWDTAYELSMRAYSASEKMSNMLCATWCRLLESTASSAERTETTSKINQELDCNLSP